MGKIKITKDKRAWLKILEVFIAITLVFSVAIIVYSRTTKETETGTEIKRIERVILQEISRNDEMRTAVLENDNTSVRNYVRSRMHPSLDSDVTICKLDEICNIYVKGKDVYVDETVISANLTLYEPKRLRLFVWRK